MNLDVDLRRYDAATLDGLAQAEGYLNREELERDGVVVGLDDLRTPLAVAVHVLQGRLHNDPHWHEPWAEGLTTTRRANSTFS